jgi:type IV secretory pathway VirB2 component (pilin)
MQKAVAVAILALMVLALVAAPAFATETNSAAQQTAPPVVTTAPQQTDTGSFLQGLQERLTGIGTALVAVMLLVAGIVFMVAKETGKKLLIAVAVGALIILGGWQLVVMLIRDLLGR